MFGYIQRGCSGTPISRSAGIHAEGQLGTCTLYIYSQSHQKLGTYHTACVDHGLLSIYATLGRVIPYLITFYWAWGRTMARNHFVKRVETLVGDEAFLSPPG